MISKTEIIKQNLAGLKVLDIGGSGYGEENAYETDLKDAWALTNTRTTVDNNPSADLCVDLSQKELEPINNTWDVTTAFDVLEHLENPTQVLRWIPTNKLIITLPNGLSPLNRIMEKKFRSDHLYSFVPYTAEQLLSNAGWRVDKTEFQFGKWSLVAKLINLLGSLCPCYVGTGIVMYCTRIDSVSP